MLLRPYYLERIHALTSADSPSRVHFCNWYLNQSILQADFLWWDKKLDPSWQCNTGVGVFLFRMKNVLFLLVWINTENYVTQNDLLFVHTYFLPSLPLTPSLALKRSVAAHRFLNKICFNEGYLSDPKVCRSNLETLCIYIYIYIYFFFF